MALRTDGGVSIAHFESYRRETALNILDECDQFMKHDMVIVQSFAEIMRAIAGHISRNPEVLFEGSGRRVAGPAGLEAAGDLTGGDFDWGQVGEVIKIIRDALGDEKPFIQEIIKHIIGM